MKLDLALERVASSEAELADELGRVGERHRADQDVFHMTETLARMSRARIEMLGPSAERHGASVEGDAGGSEREGRLAFVREKGSELIGSRPGAGVLLLRDLRRLHLLASQASIDWMILGQAAQATRDAELLALASECHAEELRALKWTTTHIKVVTPQVLAS